MLQSQCGRYSTDSHRSVLFVHWHFVSEFFQDNREASSFDIGSVTITSFILDTVAIGLVAGSEQYSEVQRQSAPLSRPLSMPVA